MRNGSHRCWLCITAAVAVTVIAVPAASAGVHKYDTKLMINRDGYRFYHGEVNSEVRKCEGGRRVVLFKVRPGADRKLGAVRSPESGPDRGTWGLVVGPDRPPKYSVYAKVTRERHHRFACRGDRSRTLTWPES